MKRLFLWLLLSIFAIPARAAVFRGVVLSPQGQPVPQAQIWVGPTRLLEYSAAKGTVRQMTTGADGRFAVEFPDALCASRTAYARVQSDAWAWRDILLDAQEANRNENRVSLETRKGIGGPYTGIFGSPRAGEPLKLRYLGNLTTITATGRETLYSENNIGLSWLLWNEALPRVETTADQRTGWKFEAVNSGKVRVENETSAATVAHAFRDDDDSPQQTTVNIHSGLTIEGDIVTPDGAPLSGAIVTCGRGDEVLARTDDKGHFVLRRVPRDSNNDPLPIRAVAPGTPWILEKQQVFLRRNLEKSSFTLPLWKAGSGVEVRGQLTDAATGEAVAGATLGADPAYWQSSDAAGNFALRVPADEMLQIFHHDYVWRSLTLTPGTTIDLGKVALQRVARVRGQLVDEGGKTIAGVRLFARVANPQRNEWGWHSEPSAPDGAFEMRIREGEATLSSSDRNWEIVEPQKITVTRNMAPLRVVVRRAAMHEVRGRVRTPHGQPVRNAQVLVTVKRAPDFKGEDMGEFSEQQLVSSGADGRYVVRFGGAFDAPQAVTRAEGYRPFNENKKIPPQADASGHWALGDALMTPLTGQVWGRVLRSDGTPADGALVSCPETEKLSVVACDEWGRFVLQKVPEDNALIVAAQGRHFAQIISKAGDVREVTLRLRAPRVFTEAERRRMLSAAQTVNQNPYVPAIHEFTFYWQALGINNLLALALQADGALPPGAQNIAAADWNKAGKNVLILLRHAATKDAAWLRQNGPALLKKIPLHDDQKRREARTEAEYKTAFACLWGDAAARRYAQAWLETALQREDQAQRNAFDNQTLWENALRWFRCAGFAASLGDKRAAEYADNGIKWVEKTNKEVRNYDLTFQWGEALSPGGSALLTKLKSALPLEDYVKTIGSAVYSMAFYDWKRAAALRPLLPPLLKEISDVRTFDANHTESEIRRSIETSFLQLRSAQAASDPQGALQELEAEFARSNRTRNSPYSDKFGWGVRMIAARTALQQKQPALAREALQPALQADIHGSAVFFADFALIAERFDKNLARALWDKAENEKKPRGDYRYPLAQFAALRARRNPALSRLELEWCHAELPEIVDDESLYLSDKEDYSGYFIAANFERALELSGYNEKKQKPLRAKFIAHLLLSFTNPQILTYDYYGLSP